MIVGALLEEDARYAKQWIGESAVWRQAGVYKQVASLVDLQPTHWHADFCSGYSFPLLSLYKRAPKESNVQLIALERITAMIVEARKLAEDYGIPTAGHVIDSFDVSPDLVATRRYEPQAEHGDLFGTASAITFIQDDVRTANVFRHLLKGRKLDSASMLFPGTSSSTAFEAPYNFLESKDPAKYAKRMAEQTREARKGAIALATEFVRPGGQYLMAERLAAVADATREEIVAFALDGIQSIAGDLKGGWRGMELIMPDVDVSAAHGSVQWTHFDGKDVRQYRKGAFGDEEGKVGMYIAKITRNDVPFEDLRAS